MPSLLLVVLVLAVSSTYVIKCREKTNKSRLLGQELRICKNDIKSSKNATVNFVIENGYCVK